jgi:hypothetical protein
MSSLIILDDIDELEEYRMLKQLADEFDMPIGEVRRLAIIFTILEIDPIKEHTGGVFVMKKMKVNGFGFLNAVPPEDAICDLRIAWVSASEDSAIAKLFIRELEAKPRLDAEDIQLWLQVIANQLAWSSFWSLRHPTQKRRDGFKAEAEVYRRLSGRVEEKAKLEFRQ